MGWTARVAAALLLCSVAANAEALVVCGAKKAGTETLKDGATLRLRAVCKPREFQIDPATAGLQGPPGAPGAPGEPGEQGPAGPSDAFAFTDQANLFPGNDELTLFASRTLPPGSYVVFGRYHIENNGLVGDRADIGCLLQVGTVSDYAIVTVPARETTMGYTDGVMSLMVVVDLAEETTAELSCGQFDTASTAVFGRNARIVAIRVQTADVIEQF